MTDHLTTTLAEALRAALEWIDAVPQSVVLPTMPGFDRDEVNDALAKFESSLREHAAQAAQPLPESATRTTLVRACRSRRGAAAWA